MNSLDEEEQLFVMAHEIYHIANDHIKRGESKDPEVWNVATDSVTNRNLVRDGLKMPKDCIYREDAMMYDAETLYEELIEKKNQLPKCNNHNIWKRKPNKGSSNEEIDQELEQEIEKIVKIGEKESSKKNRELKKQNLKKMCTSLVEESIGRENTNSSTINIDHIGNSKALINWLRLLKENVKNLVDWSYVNAQIENGILLPKLEQLPYSDTEILLDTSGSVSKELLKNFLRECKNIIKNSTLKVGCFDERFYGFTTIKTKNDIDQMTYIGGGGTDFSVAINAFSKGAANKIIFTDGEADMPKKRLNVIWIVYGTKKINPLGGKVIYINTDELKKLQYEYNNKDGYKRR